MSNTTHDVYPLSENVNLQLDMHGEVERETADISSNHLDGSSINSFADQYSTSNSLTHIINELDIACPNDGYSTEEMAKRHRFISDASDGSNIISTNMQFNEVFYPNSYNSRGIIIFLCPKSRVNTISRKISIKHLGL